MSGSRPSVRSMTGFGDAVEECAQGGVRVELRSVNHRGLTLKLSLPPEFAPFEQAVDRCVRERVTRGSVQAKITFEPSAASASLRFDPQLARRYLAELDRFIGAVGSEMTSDTRPSLEFVLGLPGVMVPDSSSIDEPALEVALMSALGAAHGAFDASRQREGAAILADIEGHLTALEALADEVSTEWPGVVAAYQDRLEQRVVDFLERRGQAVDSADVLREVAIFADRSDVAEELVRFKTHIQEARRLLGQGGSVGRKLEFLAQEFLREANTIGSKVADAQVAHRVVEVKSVLDRFREQVQNLE